MIKALTFQFTQEDVDDRECEKIVQKQVNFDNFLREIEMRLLI